MTTLKQDNDFADALESTLGEKAQKWDKASSLKDGILGLVESAEADRIERIRLTLVLEQEFARQKMRDEMAEADREDARKWRMHHPFKCGHASVGHNDGPCCAVCDGGEREDALRQRVERLTILLRVGAVLMDDHKCKEGECGQWQGDVRTALTEGGEDA